jgi:hypothetical protein
LLSGCTPAPSFEAFGSFFPIWIFCLAAGIVLTALVDVLLRGTGWRQELGPRAVIYPSLVGLFTFTIWLILFRR